MAEIIESVVEKVFESGVARLAVANSFRWRP